MVQLYSAFAYHGPPIAYTVASDLAELLRQDGFNSVHEAVGVNQKWTQDLSNIIIPQETDEIKFEGQVLQMLCTYIRSATMKPK